MDHAMDLAKEGEEYNIVATTATNRHHRQQPQTDSKKSRKGKGGGQQEELRVTCHLYLASRTSLLLGTSSGLLAVWRPKNEFHVEIVRSTLSGHRGTIFDILFLGGEEAAAGGRWGHATSGSTASLSLVATASADRTVKIWDVFERDLKQRCIQTLIGHEGSVTSLTFLRGSLITCSTDNSVKIWRSSADRSLLLYPFFEVVQEIWGPGGSHVPTTLVGLLGQAPSVSIDSPVGVSASVPLSVFGSEKSVLKSCPCVVGRLVRAEHQLLFIGDSQGRVYTFMPPAKGGLAASTLPKQLRDSSESTRINSTITTPRGKQSDAARPTSSASHQSLSTSSAGSALIGSGVGGGTTEFTLSHSHKIHALSVSRMLIVSQESLIITLSFDHTVQVHDCMNAGGIYFGIENPTRCRYLDMAWDPQSQELFLADEGGHIQVWNVYTEHCIKCIKLKHEPIYSLSLHGPKLLVGVAGGVEVFTIQRNVAFNEFKGHDGPIVQLLQIQSSSLSNVNLSQLGFKSSGGESATRVTAGGRKVVQSIGEVNLASERYLYSASLDLTIRQWDSSDMACLSIIQERASEISCMAYLPGSIILATGHDEGVIRLWNIDSGTYMNMPHHRNTVSCLCVAKTPRQDCLISGSFDRTIAVWDVTRQRSFNPVPEYSLRVSDEEVLCCGYHSQLGLIFTGGNDTLIHMWNIESRAKEGVFRGHRNAVGCLAIDGNFLISGSDDTTIIVWNIHLQYQVAVLTGHDLAIRDLLVIPMHGFIVSAAFDGRVIVWNYLRACAIKQFHHIGKRFRCLLYDDAQRKIFAGTEESRIIVLSLASFLDSTSPVVQPVSRPSLPEEHFPVRSDRQPSAGSSREETKELAVGVVPLAAASPRHSLATTRATSPSERTTHSLAAESAVDWSAIVAELTGQSIQIQSLLSTVKALPARPTAAQQVQSSHESKGVGTGGQAASALKRNQQAPSVAAPSQARRASLTNHLVIQAALAAAAHSKQPVLAAELSPPTIGQLQAFRRASQNAKDLPLRSRPHSPLPSAITGTGLAPSTFVFASATAISTAPSTGAVATPTVQPRSISQFVSHPDPTSGLISNVGRRGSLTSGHLLSIADLLKATPAAPSTRIDNTIAPMETHHSARAPISASVDDGHTRTANSNASSVVVAPMARRASMTSAALRDLSALLKPQPAVAVDARADSSTHLPPAHSPVDGAIDPTSPPHNQLPGQPTSIGGDATATITDSNHLSASDGPTLSRVPSATSAIFAGLAADAPLADLAPTTRAHRFSMPSSKGRLQFDV